MKRILSVILSLAFLLAVAPPAAVSFTAAASESDFRYSVSNGEATITGYTGSGGDLAIPAALGGYPVTAIDPWVFSRCTGLTSVTVPEGVASIGEDAFYCCTELTSVTIPAGVTSIGEEAFAHCTGLTSVTIPSGVTNPRCPSWPTPWRLGASADPSARWRC